MGGSISVRPKFDLNLKNEKIEEQDEMDDSREESKPKEKPRQSNLANFMQEFQQMNESDGISKSHSSFVSDISKPETKTPENPKERKLTPPKHVER